MSVGRLCRRLWPALLLLGCGNQAPIPAPARFDRPNRVDFVCVSNGYPVKMHHCTDGLDLAANPNVGVALHALVTQSARGEVAAVDLDSQTVLDTRRDIPGYTFVPVGVQPTAIVVPREHPELTYVADFASHDVRAIATHDLVAPGTGKPTGQVVALMVDTAGGKVPAAPTDMVLAPDEDALLVAVPDLGRVLRLPLQRCHGQTANGCQEGFIDEAGISSVLVQGSADRVSAPTASTEPPSSYSLLCDYNWQDPPPPQPVQLPADAFALPPRPQALAVDAYCRDGQPCTRRLLVADATWPVIHVIDLDAIAPGTEGSEALLAPLVTGVPTRAVAVTPRVPVSLDSSAETQYVYAVDAGDGSVLALEHGTLLNVNADPSGRPDRLEVAGVGPAQPAATALAVLTPGFDVARPSNQQYVRPTPDQPPQTAAESITYCTDSSDQVEDPARLRGVFLAVALTDGTVRVVDVHDLELKPAAGAKDACRQCQPHYPAVVRNQARIAVSFVQAAGTDLVPLTPSVSTFGFQVAGLSFPIQVDGSNGSPDAPEMDCIACDSDLVATYPSADLATTDQSDPCYQRALLCGDENPWHASESWDAVYEGLIPNTFGGDGQASLPGSTDNISGAPELQAAAMDFCGAGVLGDDDVGAAFEGVNCSADAAQQPPLGDQLVIRSPILGKAGLDLLEPGLGKADITKCADAAKALEDDPTLALAFGIRRAYRDRLVISDRLVKPVGKLRSYEDVLRCVGPDPLSFEVNTRGMFRVHGGQSGFQHRVHATAVGRCVVDPGADALLRGRARFGCTFRNRSVAFRIRPLASAGQTLDPGVALLIQTVTPAVHLLLNANAVGLGGTTVVPSELRYSDADGWLYLVDIANRGLVPIPLDPFPAAVDSSGTFD